jgi:ADP-ribosylglycohydrolase
MSTQQMYNSLLALSVGDAAGENQMKMIMPTGAIWSWTDDTQLAIGVYRTLKKYKEINQLELAKEFAKNYLGDPGRGFGQGTARLLQAYQYDVENWKDHSENWWGPKQGSKGNGSAMRDSIIGAYFENMDDVVTNARLSAEVTHFHEEAIAGSIAVALAANIVTNIWPNSSIIISQYWPSIFDRIPRGELKDRIAWVCSKKGLNETNWGVVVKVGNGKDVTALDTVPFALWQAYQTITKKLTFEQTIDSIIEVGGDTDTVAAMVGGIIGNKIQPTQEWIDRTEPLPVDVDDFFIPRKT